MTLWELIQVMFNAILVRQQAHNDMNQARDLLIAAVQQALAPGGNLPDAAHWQTIRDRHTAYVAAWEALDRATADVFTAAQTLAAYGSDPAAAAPAGALNGKNAGGPTLKLKKG